MATTTDDGRLIASGGDALVAVDLSTGELLWSREFATAQPAPCPWLAVAQTRSTVFCGDLWGGIEESCSTRDSPTGRQLDSQLGAVGPLTVSPDGDELVAIGAGSSAISRWSLDGSGAITRMIARGQVAAAGYDPAGTSILVAARSPGRDELGRSHRVLGVGSTQGRRTLAYSGTGPVRRLGGHGHAAALDLRSADSAISARRPASTSRATRFLRTWAAGSAIPGVAPTSPTSPAPLRRSIPARSGASSRRCDSTASPSRSVRAPMARRSPSRRRRTASRPPASSTLRPVRRSRPSSPDPSSP